MAVAIALMLAMKVAGTVAAQAPAPTGVVQKITVHGKSLERNLNGDTPDRAVLSVPGGYDRRRRPAFAAARRHDQGQQVTESVSTVPGGGGVFREPAIR